MIPPVGLIPDSVYGAVLLSLIDFFLSFLVIAFIGFVLALFPRLNRTKALQATPVAVSVMPARGKNAEHAAVIAAATYATLGARHIIHIGEPPAPGWALQYRMRVHTRLTAPAAEKAVEAGWPSSSGPRASASPGRRRRSKVRHAAMALACRTSASRSRVRQIS